MQSEMLNIPDSVAHLSEAQSQMLESHDSTLITHNEEINTLKQNFGVHQPSILVSTESQYLQVLSDIRIAALAKNGQVCSTLRLTDATLPLILPCPQALCDRDITVMKVCTPPNYCANNSDVIYIQSPQPHTRLGIMTPGSNPFDNFVYRSNPSPALNITGCKAFKLSPETSGSFTALRGIDYSECFALSFRSVTDNNKFYWQFMGVSSFFAYVSPADARRWESGIQQVMGLSNWTPKFNAYVIPRTFITSAYFTVTDTMGSIVWAGTSGRNSMTVPTTLPEGFRFEVQNNSTYTLIVSGTAISGGIKSIPPRSICGVKKVAGTLIIWIMLESLDTSTGKK